MLHWMNTHDAGRTLEYVLIIIIGLGFSRVIELLEDIKNKKE